MKVLILEWNGFGYRDIKEAFQTLGYTTVSVDFPKDEPKSNKPFEENLARIIEREKPDFMFSFNYFPVIALVGKATQTKYVAWIYDNPLVILYSYTIIFPTNYVFVFDKTEYNKFRNNGINTIYYLPLCSNAKRLSGCDISQMSASDISFVGSMYNESHSFYSRLKNISDRTRGYLEGIMAAQRQVYGYNFIEELMTPEIMDDMMRDLPMEPDADSVETREYLFAQYVINRYITEVERKELLSRIGQRYTFDLYTPNKDFSMPGCRNHGSVDVYEGACRVFKNSKINLNITLRSIITGIPLRAFEILGSGGFLLTNYQADFDDCYTAFEDYVYFEDPDDMMTKIEFFLSHEKERREIAANGLRKTLENHTFEQRVRTIAEILSGKNI